jgi:16S rRNA (adenine1518-N6/adenine1519-N6)-dimethyltransferase
LFTPFCEEIAHFSCARAAIVDLCMRLSEINETLRKIRVSPVKTLGQNFLHDRNLAYWIVRQAEITPGDYVVEIGPGLGALTEFLLDSGAHVLAIEKDARLANFLRGKFHNRQLEVLQADALKFDTQKLFPQRNVKLVGNFPYYISSQLVLKFIHFPSPISLWVLMLQKEMARRFSASPSTSDYGALTLQVQLHYRVKYLRTVRATVFFPQPAVDSAVVRVAPRDPFELPECDYGVLPKLVRRGFSQRRKQLGKLLRQELPYWNDAAKTLGFNPAARAENLSLQQWIGLTNLIAPLPVSEDPSRQMERFPVVDQSDRVLGSASRAEVHGNNLRHRAVHILIFNDAGEVYLQKRSRRKDRHPLLWDSSAAGHVDASEEYDEAARRELKEELEIDIALEKVLKLPASERTGQEFIWLYRGQHTGALQFNRSEIEHGDFFPVALVSDWLAGRPEDFAPGFVECWKAYRESKP